MKKVNSIKALLCAMGLFLLTISAHAQTTILHPVGIGDISGKIAWDNPPCAGIVPWKMITSGTTATKVYNFTVELREYKAQPAGSLNGPYAPGNIITGAKVTFGATTATGQAFTITGIPISVTKAFVVFKPKDGLCPNCVNNLISMPNVVVDHSSATKVSTKMSCQTAPK